MYAGSLCYINKSKMKVTLLDAPWPQRPLPAIHASRERLSRKAARRQHWHLVVSASHPFTHVTKKKQHIMQQSPKELRDDEWPDLHKKTAVAHGLHQRELVDYAGVGRQLSRNHSDSERERKRVFSL